MTSKTKPKVKHWYLAKELFLALLGVVSVGIVVFDVIFHPNNSVQHKLNNLDFVVAIMFLIDFGLELMYTKNRGHYLKRNWYFLLAAIPLTDSVVESLRIVRVIRLIRILRASEHIDFSIRQDSPS